MSFACARSNVARYLMVIVVIASVAACTAQPESSTRNRDVDATQGSCSTFSAYLGYQGSVVTIAGSVLEPESTKLERAWADFESCTGITIEYTGRDDIDSIFADADALPNLGVIPRWGLVGDLVEQRLLRQAPNNVIDAVTANWSESWIPYVTFDGTVLASPLGAYVSTMVWFAPSATTKVSIDPPNSWAQLDALSNALVDRGITPWCLGLEAGTATGLPALELLANIVLRTSGPETYDAWTRGELPFESPQIAEAMNVLDRWLRNRAFVNGGFGSVKSIATTPASESGKPIVDGRCAMTPQGSYYAGQWPIFDRDVSIGSAGDVWAFALPAFAAEEPPPMIGGGEFVVAFADDPSTHAVWHYLTSTDFFTNRVEEGNWITAHRGVTAAAYPAPIDALVADYLTQPDATFRLNPTDLMAERGDVTTIIGPLTSWFNGRNTAKVLKEIDAGWLPSLR